MLVGNSMEPVMRRIYLPVGLNTTLSSANLNQGSITLLHGSEMKEMGDVPLAK
jgi:hypothetical protein